MSRETDRPGAGGVRRRSTVVVALLAVPILALLWMAAGPSGWRRPFAGRVMAWIDAHDPRRHEVALDDYCACTPTADCTRGLAWALQAASGKTLGVRAGCIALVAGPPAGAAALTIPTATRIQCETPASAGFMLAGRRCTRGRYAGAACAADGDCDYCGTACAGARCAVDGGLAEAFAPAAGSDYTLFAAAPNSRNVSIVDCGIFVEGVDRFQRCSAGAKPCLQSCDARSGSPGQTCSTSGCAGGGTCAPALYSYRCSGGTQDGQYCCAPAGFPDGTCENVSDCSNGGDATCDREPGAPSGAGRTNAIDLSAATGGAVVDVVVYDVRHASFGVKLGSWSRVTGSVMGRSRCTPVPRSAACGAALGTLPAYAVTSGIVTTGFDRVTDNDVFGATGISGSGEGNVYRGNRIPLTEPTAHPLPYPSVGGIVDAGPDGNVSGNKLTMRGGRAIEVGANSQIVANDVKCNNVPGEVGIYLNGQHIEVGNNTVSNCWTGLRCDPEHAVNDTIVGNDFVFGNGAKAVLLGSGIHFASNYAAWNSGTGGLCGAADGWKPCLASVDCPRTGACTPDPVIWVGTPEARSAAAGHVQIEDNELHTERVECPALVKVADPGKRCVGGMRALEPCATNAECPVHASCEPVLHTDLVVSNNSLLAGGAAFGVDVGGLASGATFLTGFTMEGNHFSRSAHGAAAFPPSASTFCLNGARLGTPCTLDTTDAERGCGEGASCPGCCAPLLSHAFVAQNNVLSVATPWTNWSDVFGVKASNADDAGRP